MPDLELRALGPDVYACLQPDRGLGFSNSGLINRGGALVIDTFWDLPHTRALRAEYERVLKAPPAQLLNTHHNGDHCWGNQLFPEAEILAHRGCAERFGRERPEAMQALRELREHPDPPVRALAAALAEWDFRGIEPRPPTRILDGDLELELGGRPVHLIHVGPAHTAGDVIAHLPEDGILFAGDIVFRLCTPIGWEGTTEQWIRALDRIEALAPAVIVPGHGPLCGVEGVREQRAYLRYVRDEAEHFFRAGVPVLDAARRIDLGPYADWTEPERVVFNLERAYRELRGDPHDAPLDVTALFRGVFTLRGEPGFPRCGGGERDA